MAEYVEVVIKIPKIAYDIIKQQSDDYYDAVTTYSETIGSAIAKGIPFPKGCGRVVDIDKLIDSKCNECGHVKGVSCTVPCYEVRRMLSAPTVIEAEKPDEHSHSLNDYMATSDSSDVVKKLENVEEKDEQEVDR